MFASTHRPEPGARESARPDRRLVPGRPETLGTRQSTSILGITEQALVAGPPAGPRGLEPVEVSGVVTTDRPIARVANALLYDGDQPDAPTSFAIPLVDAGGGRYTYSLPLDLPTGHLGGHRGAHRYAVAVTVQDPTSTAGADASLTLDAPRARPTHPAPPRPAGARR